MRLLKILSAFVALISVQVVLVHQSNAWMNVATVGGGGVPVAVSCATTEQSATGTGGFDSYVGYDHDYTATKITTDGDGVAVCKIGLYLKKSGTPVSTLTVSLWTDSSGPSSKVSDCGTISGGSIGADYGEVTATCGSPISLSASTSYWVAIHSTTINTTNFIYWGADWFGSGVTKVGDATPTWSDYTTRICAYVLYK